MASSDQCLPSHCRKHENFEGHPKFSNVIPQLISEHENGNGRCQVSAVIWYGNQGR